MDIDSLIIQPAELRTLLRERPASITLLDVREPEEFAEDRLENGKLIPLGDLMARARSELNPNDEIVVYCAHGVRSMHAVMGLRTLGFTRLRSLEGGLSAYREGE